MGMGPVSNEGRVGPITAGIIRKRHYGQVLSDGCGRVSENGRRRSLKVGVQTLESIFGEKRRSGNSRRSPKTE